MYGDCDCGPTLGQAAAWGLGLVGLSVFSCGVIVGVAYGTIVTVARGLMVLSNRT